MTVLAAAYDPETGAAAMAADSLMSGGGLSCQSNPKILRLGDALVGLSGSPLYQRPIRDIGKEKPFVVGMDAREWCEALINWVIDFGRTRGHGGNHGNHMHSQNLDILVVLRGGGIWTLSCEGDATPVVSPRYWAAGSGREVAVGAMYALLLELDYDDFPTPEGLVHTAAKAACELVTTCRGPIQIEELPPLLGPVSGELALEDAPKAL